MTAADRSPLAVCRNIRSKGAGVVYGEAVTWDAGDRSTAVFWCLATADALGPDDGFVHPHVCTENRECFCGSDDRAVPSDADPAAACQDPNRVA